MDNPASPGQVYNLGSDTEVSVNELANQVIRICSSTSRIEHLTYEQAYGQRFDDLPRRVPKLDKIRSVIEFKPRFSLEEIIRSVKDYLAATPG
jgi:UDP-glucose 4-epimerase